jgi:hypothetical protein
MPISEHTNNNCPGRQFCRKQQQEEQQQQRKVAGASVQADVLICRNTMLMLQQMAVQHLRGYRQFVLL